MDKHELAARLKKFALRILRLVRALPRTADGRAVANQLARCGPAVGANYRSALRARSKAEFIARMGIVEEEADESAYWLEIITESQILKPAAVAPLLTEAYEIVAIASATRKSAQRSNRKSEIQNRKSSLPGGDAAPKGNDRAR